MRKTKSIILSLLTVLATAFLIVLFSMVFDPDTYRWLGKVFAADNPTMPDPKRDSITVRSDSIALKKLGFETNDDPAIPNPERDSITLRELKKLGFEAKAK